MEKKNGRSICGYEISSDKLAEQLLKNKDIYVLNNGGVTFTGGARLLHADFLEDVVRKIKPDIHVAIETSGYATDHIFRSVIPIFDIVLLDIKHTDPEIHKAYTGVDNKQILKNLEFLCLSHIDFVVRIPLIPGVNDMKKNMLNILSFIKDAQSLQRVEFSK